VAQILGPDGRNLLVGRPANLRRWAANHLGLGKPAPKGRRPPTNLSPIATSVAFAEATSSFHQRLLYERLLERHVPRAKRRDLKPPGWLRLDAAERFPRIVVESGEEAARLAAPSVLFGPFRDRRAADRARTALHKRWPLRPCDYVFEPHPELPLGLACLFAQVRSCAAPCLRRVSEDAYRTLAREVVAVLTGDAPRPQELRSALPDFVSEAGARGLVVVSTREGVELYPVGGGAVLEEAQVALPRSAIDADEACLPNALRTLRFEVPIPSRDDRPWLLAFLLASRRGALYLVVRPGLSEAALAGRVREVLS
jgi:excinuclease ABC subunit C